MACLAPAPGRVGRPAARAGPAEDPAAVDSPVTAVGFAELVGFTTLSRRLSDQELAGLVERFEASGRALKAKRVRGYEHLACWSVRRPPR